MPKKTNRHEEDSFYEAMPATADQFGTWNAEPEAAPDELSDEKQLTIEDTKTTAIVTLILTAIVAIGLTLLFIRGLEMLKGATPQQTTTTQLR